MPLSWQDYLHALDKEAFRQAFDVLKTILLEDDLEYADRVLAEALKHSSASPEAILITYKRLKENRVIYESSLTIPSDLPPYEVDISQYDTLMGWISMRKEISNYQRN